MTFWKLKLFEWFYLLNWYFLTTFQPWFSNLSRSDFLAISIYGSLIYLHSLYVFLSLLDPYSIKFFNSFFKFQGFKYVVFCPGLLSHSMPGGINPTIYYASMVIFSKVPIISLSSVYSFWYRGNNKTTVITCDYWNGW